MGQQPSALRTSSALFAASPARADNVVARVASIFRPACLLSERCSLRSGPRMLPIRLFDFLHFVLALALSSFAWIFVIVLETVFRIFALTASDEAAFSAAVMPS